MSLNKGAKEELAQGATKNKEEGRMQARERDPPKNPRLFFLFPKHLTQLVSQEEEILQSTGGNLGETQPANKGNDLRGKERGKGRSLIRGKGTQLPSPRIRRRFSPQLKQR